MSNDYGGSPTSKIYIVGDGKGELTAGAERLLNRLLMEAGLTREECRVAHLIDSPIPYRKFFHLYEDKGLRIPKPALAAGIEKVKEDIRKCNPNVIVALGNIALRALTKEGGIKNWRGSILFNSGLGCKVIPTFHPKDLLKSWNNVPLVMFDFKRIREESRTPEYSLRKRDLIVRPSYDEVVEEIKRLGKTKRVSFDVETDEDGHITALSITDSPWRAMSIPFTNSTGAPYWILEREIAIWKMVKEVMEDEGIEKIAQNAQFDIIMFKVNPYHINVKGLVIDTMCAHHTVYPEMAASETQATGKHRIGGGKGLGLLCSIYTRQPYYKHWGKSGTDEIFWKYNGMDAAVTFEIAEVLEREMKEFGVYDFYHKFVHPLIPILIDMQMRGVKVDQTIRQQAYDTYESETVELQDKMNKALGRVINVMSPKQLRELLYDELNLPPQYKRGTSKLTADEEALENLGNKFNSPIFDYILKIRHNRKLIGTYLNNAGGEDGRVRCSYIIGGTETGRLSSRKSVFRTGTNLQNVPPGICRRMFVADAGKVFVQADLSQAEARIVAYLAEDERMIETFEKGEDIHQLSANNLPDDFVPIGSAYQNVPNPRRLFAKKHVHAFNYGEGARVFAKRARIGGLEASLIQQQYFDRFPKIKAWHMRTQAMLGKCRTVTTPMGRRRTFFGLWGEALFREAYAFIPQSTVADVLNLALIRFYNKYPEIEVMLQIHDAFVFQIPSFEAVNLKEIFNIPIYINGRTFTIPAEIKVGKNWDEMEKVK